MSFDTGVGKVDIFFQRRERGQGTTVLTVGLGSALCFRVSQELKLLSHSSYRCAIFMTF
jgi:hypothetical protein